MGWLHPVLEQARTVDGRRRFYAPGAHPSLARHLQALERLEFLGFDRSEAADRLRNEVAAFEQRQSDDKLAYLLRVESR